MITLELEDQEAEFILKSLVDFHRIAVFRADDKKLLDEEETMIKGLLEKLAHQGVFQ